MVIIDGGKYSCDSCIRGHRSSRCTHFERELIRVRPKGRPPQLKQMKGSDVGSRQQIKRVVSAGCGCAAKYRPPHQHEVPSQQLDSKNYNYLTDELRSIETMSTMTSCSSSATSLSSANTSPLVEVGPYHIENPHNNGVYYTPEQPYAYPHIKQEPCKPMDISYAPYRPIQQLRHESPIPISVTQLPFQHQRPGYQDHSSAVAAAAANSVISASPSHTTPHSVYLQDPRNVQQLPINEHTLSTIPSYDLLSRYFYKSQCAMEGASCHCGDACNCVGCTTHVNNYETQRILQNAQKENLEELTPFAEPYYNAIPTQTPASYR